MSEHPHRIFVAIPLYAANDRGYAEYFRAEGEYVQELDQMTHINLMVHLPVSYQRKNSSDVYEDLRNTARFPLEIDDLPCLLLEDDQDQRLLLRIKDDPLILRATFRSLCEALRHASERTSLASIAERLIVRRPDILIVNSKHETITLPPRYSMIEDYIWYVRATFNDGSPPSEGSAVAIRLKPENNPYQTYLLTCEHVLRANSAHHKPNHGAVAAEENIRVWAPGTAESDEQGIAVTIVDDIRLVTREGIYPHVEFSATNDWVVLKIMDADAANASEALWKSDWAQDSPEGKEFTIVGYPGGREAYVKGIVKPTSVRPPAHFYGEENRVITLTGDQTKPGMSGGGAFEFLSAGNHGRFYGLHRARYETIGKVHALDTTYIRERIESKDVPYSLAERRQTPVEKDVKPQPRRAQRDETSHSAESKQPQPSKGKRRWFRLVVSIFFLLTLVAILIGWQVLGPAPKTEIPVTLQERVLDDRGTLIELKPLPGATLALEPDGFKLDSLSNNVTDRDGKTTLLFDHNSPDTKLAVYFIVEVPRSPEPYVTTRAGAIRNGKSLNILTKGDPELLEAGQAVKLDAVPLSKTRAFYGNLALKAAGATGVDIVDRLAAAENQLTEWKLDGDLKAGALDFVAGELLESRPAFAADLMAAGPDTPFVTDTVQSSAASVCYVKRRDSKNKFDQSGFVIGKELVATVIFNDESDFESVGFGRDPSDTADVMRLNVTKVQSFSELQLALLHVPGLTQEPLQLAGENPFAKPDSKKQIAVIGYGEPREGVPRPLAAQLELDAKISKRIMPGDYLGSTTDSILAGRNMLRYDASTMPGVSGGPVFDLSSGLVVGVHYAGGLGAKRSERVGLPIWTALSNPEFTAATNAVGAAGVKIDEAKLNEELKKLLLPLLAGLHYEVKDLRERHREDTIILGQKIVVYWRSRLSASIQAIDQGKDAEIRAVLAEVDPQTIRLGIVLQAPLQGKIDARALTDNPEVEIARVDTNYTTKLIASLEATVVFDADRSRVLEVKIPKWDVRFQETRFEHALADKLAPLVQDYLNKKSRDETAKLLEKAQQDLQRTIKSSTQPK